MAKKLWEIQYLHNDSVSVGLKHIELASRNTQIVQHTNLKMLRPKDIMALAIFCWENSRQASRCQAFEPYKYLGSQGQTFNVLPHHFTRKRLAPTAYYEPYRQDYVTRLLMTHCQHTPEFDKCDLLVHDDPSTWAVQSDYIKETQGECVTTTLLDILYVVSIHVSTAKD